MTPESPCTRVCKLDERDYCVGCGRSKTQIRDWMRYSNEQKIAINKQLQYNREVNSETR